ncbi:2-polyprenyl-3-methyl-6-methoxy-1,4-benzoquinone monooxygenase [Thiotrichales bacterium 19S9-12]|nr:2-polyprenyl-3-methyl-6-methoxy-1,4-benzoquinone monooxygenase [Thiotrichales bacterium 19S9-11]MCF6811479.1 2-polyprenyl-3-methyl-6-methoxy-1,4-benzoquinone monooxygenase [Thiotrichales bacterium 19S9-12]
MTRHYTLFDKLLIELEHAAKTILTKKTISSRKSPADTIKNTTPLDNNKKQKSSALMRIDHTGEICAQALYRGQAFVAKTESTRAHLWHAADEEHDHLAWCQKRLNELNSHRSFLNPFWYSGSFIIGATAGLVSDQLSYSFVVETENQVMKHLDEHLEHLPTEDKKSHAILNQMKTDEEQHAKNAQKRGGKRLPFPIRAIMKLQSKVMTTTAYYF